MIEGKYEDYIEIKLRYNVMLSLQTQYSLGKKKHICDKVKRVFRLIQSILLIVNLLQQLFALVLAPY